MVRALFYTFARLTEGAPLSLCQKHKVQKHSTTKEQEQERELRGGVVPVPVPVFVFQLQPALFLRINF